MHNSDYPSHSQSPQPRKRHRVRNILLGIAGAFILLIILVSVFSHPKPQAASPAPATQSAPVTSAAAQPAATQPVQPAATAPPPAPVTVGRFSGSGDYSSPPFTLNGNPVTVTYTYSGNIMAGETTGDNFQADISSSGDDQSIANTISVSGGTTTTLYPNTSFGGSTSYHLSVTASGSWSFTITEAG